MITFLLAMAISAQSVVVSEDPILYEIREDYTILYEIREDYTKIEAEIAVSNVELEPVHTSSIWPSFCSSNVERTACDDSTQDETYFK